MSLPFLKIFKLELLILKRDELAYLHAEWLSKLKYEALNPDEIKNILKAVQPQHARDYEKADALREFFENIENSPNVQIKATTVKGVTVDPSNPEKIERKTMKVTASTNLLDISDGGNDPGYKKVIEQIKAATKSSADDFTPAPSIL